MVETAKRRWVFLFRNIILVTRIDTAVGINFALLRYIAYRIRSVSLVQFNCVNRVSCAMRLINWLCVRRDWFSRPTCDHCSSFLARGVWEDHRLWPINLSRRNLEEWGGRIHRFKTGYARNPLDWWMGPAGWYDIRWFQSFPSGETRTGNPWKGYTRWMWNVDVPHWGRRPRADTTPQSSEIWFLGTNRHQSYRFTGLRCYKKIKIDAAGAQQSCESSDGQSAMQDIVSAAREIPG